MSETFKDLELEFPLFEGPISEAIGYVGSEYCEKCDAQAGHVFEINEELVCYACLRNRRVSIVQDTEFGMVTDEFAELGQTHGTPILKTDMFPVVTTSGGWQSAVIPSDDLWELITTPNYATWQGERWLFCCAKPMVYIGVWSKEAFKAASTNDDAYSQAELMVDATEVTNWNGVFPDEMTFYAFRCSICDKHRAHCDID